MVDFDDFTEFFIHLPDDPEEAYVVFHQRCAEELAANTNEESGDHFERIFVEKMLAFDEVYNLRVFSFWAEIPASNSEFWDYFRSVRSIARTTAVKFQLTQARRRSVNPEGIVKLDGNARKAIHALLDALRGELEQLELTDDKRAELFRKLNAFAHEVDQNLTRTEGIFRLARELGRLVQDAGDHLKPITDRVDRIIDMLDGAQKWVESLPTWTRRKELPAPPDKRPEAKQTSVDDDIPF